MPSYDLAERSTLFECDDPLDEEFGGQALMTGSLGELIRLAMTWPDCRLAGARITTSRDAGYRQREIEDIYNQQLF